MDVSRTGIPALFLTFPASRRVADDFAAGADELFRMVIIAAKVAATAKNENPKTLVVRFMTSLL
jgi:hypothetical protein